VKIVLSLKPPYIGETSPRLMGSVKDSGFYTLVLPTGAGKTLNVLRVISGIYKETQWMPRRIIYALPFVSLVEQTEEVYRKVLGEEQVASLHYLSEIDDVEEKYLRGWQRSVDSPQWRSPVVITTFVRLWDMLVPRRGGDLVSRRFLFNSLIILDEIQSFPIEYWSALRRLMEVYAERYKTRFILMTATIPTLFTEMNVHNVVEMDENIWRRYLSRRRYHFVDGMVSIDRLAEMIKTEDKTTLVIVNTRKKAYDLSEKLGLPVLTSSEPKFIRWVLIDAVKKGKINKLVATQTVEAGADIDFDVVYREMSPMGSIIQSGGRCNRGGRRGDFTVKVFRFDDTEDNFSSVYGDAYLNIMKDVLDSVWGSVIKEDILYEMWKKVQEEIIGRIDESRVDEYIRIGNFSAIREREKGLIREVSKSVYVIPPKWYKRFQKMKETGRMPSDRYNFCRYVIFADDVPFNSSFNSKRIRQWLPLFAYSLPVDVGGKEAIDDLNLYVFSGDDLKEWQRKALNIDRCSLLGIDSS